MGIAVDATDVYWFDSGSNATGRIMKCSKGGCGSNPTVLVSRSQLFGKELAVDATDVYFTAGSEVWRCAKGGCGGTPTLVAACQNEPGEIATDANNVYWTNNGSIGNGYSDGAIMKLAK